MRTRSQGPPEPVVPSTRRPRRRGVAASGPFSDDESSDKHTVGNEEDVATSSQRRERGRSCPPERRTRGDQQSVSPPHSPARAARQLFGQQVPVHTVPVQPPAPPVVRLMAAKYPQFRGKSYEDPDAHTRKFDKTYEINNAPPVVPQHKESVFESTLSGKASQWLAEFPADHFLTYDAVRTAFLRRFRIEKTVAQNLEKLRTLKQGKRTAEEYAARFRVMLQRVPQAQHPALEVLNDYFLKGLSKDLRTALATVDKVNTALADVIAMAMLAGESLEDDDTPSKRKTKKKHSTKGKSKKSSDEDSDSSSTGSSLEEDSRQRLRG